MLLIIPDMFAKMVIELITQYSLGELISLKELSDGYANTNYKLETSTGNYLLRLCRQQPLRNVLKEIDLFNTLESYNFPAAYPVSNKKGKFASEIGDETAVIYDFIEGHHPDLNEETVKEIARAVAKLNSIHLGTIAKENYLNINNAKALLNEFKDSGKNLPAIYKIFEEQFFELEPFIRNEFPTGLIHSDIFPDNTIYKGNKLQAIVDFEEFCVDHLIYDVAMTINGFCFIDNKIDLNLAHVFLDEYNSIRPLQEIELQYLKEYIRWTAVAMASWHLRNDLINTPNKRQEERVNELLQRAVDLGGKNLIF